MERKIPLKNYVILVVITVVFVFLVFYMRDWYNMTRVYYNGGSLILDVSTKINQEELGNYALENPNFILYVSSGYNDDTKKFEKDFKKYITKNHINNIVYLDASEIDINSFNAYLKNNYALNSNVSSKITDNQNITIYDFDNGKISHVIANADNQSMKTIEKLFKKYEMIYND